MEDQGSISFFVDLGFIYLVMFCLLELLISAIDSNYQDFPPQDAFKNVLGPMADDLDRCWPFRDYVATTGALNLMSRFPINEGVPKSDIGAYAHKLYHRLA